jgi:hypothetical protein
MAETNIDANHTHEEMSYKLKNQINVDFSE